MPILSVLFGRKNVKIPNRAAKPVTASSPYQSAELVVSPGNCCSAAEALAGKPLLAREAPILPLPGCDRSKCRCRYNRLADRRTEARRASDVGMHVAANMYRRAGECARQGNGRRSTDPARDPD